MHSPASGGLAPPQSGTKWAVSFGRALVLPENPPLRPRSRGRPPVISTERLLAVAREVFLELGIRATAAEVATRAGIAEGTIFHRFKSKEELFRAAMNFDPDAGRRLVEELRARAGLGD